MLKQKNILVCPLDWGIGHATRCVPIIQKLVQSQFNVIIAADKRTYAFLNHEFPDLRLIRFKGYDITYHRKSRMAIRMISLIPRLLFRIFKEHYDLKSIIKKHQIHAIISDNRFGLWNKNIYSIYITHQTNIKTPFNNQWFEKILYRIHCFFINQYNECWIPDFEGEGNLSGELSHRFTIPENAKFIGPLSRFYSLVEKDGKSFETNISMKYDIMVILSGPEPQRTILEDIIIKQLKHSSFTSIVVRGLTDKQLKEEISDNITCFSHLSTKELMMFIEKSKLIICRSGYSSIMDLSAMNKKAVFIPTPGQTEQEYLARNFMEKECFYSANQSEFNLKDAVQQSKHYKGISIKYNPAVLDTCINNLADILEGIN